MNDRKLWLKLLHFDLEAHPPYGTFQHRLNTIPGESIRTTAPGYVAVAFC